MNLQKYKRIFWKNSSPKIKYKTLCNDYNAGGLKNVDIQNKIIALPQPAITCSKLTMETPEQGVKYVQS